MRLLVLFTLLIVATASAHAQQNVSNNKQPPNNLGKQSTTDTKKTTQQPTVKKVDPVKLEEIIEMSVTEIESMQLSNDQVERLKNLRLRKDRNKATSYVSPADPITRTLPINVEPGVKPPVLRLTLGLQTSIAFSDINGQPWYIKDVSLNRNLFCDGYQCGGAGGSPNGAEKTPTNILTLEPLTTAAYGNVTVTMNGMSTPIIFILATGQKEVDMRVDAKIPGANPDGIELNTPIKTMPSIDQVLVNFLDGVPPTEAQLLRATGMEGVDAWLYRENLYVKAKATAQYPAYVSAARSPSGVTVYRFANMHNSVTFLNGGQAITVFIE